MPIEEVIIVDGVKFLKVTKEPELPAPEVKMYSKEELMTELVSCESLEAAIMTELTLCTEKKAKLNSQLTLLLS